jgi:anti-anti-sigma factor
MLKIEEQAVPGSDGVLLTLEGTLDMYASPDLKRRLDAITGARMRRIVLDLGLVDFVDSSGLAALVSTQRRMRRVEGRLQLANLTRRVRDVFELMQLSPLFEIHDSVEEALGA